MMSIDPTQFSNHPAWVGPRRYVEQKWQIDQAAKASVETRSAGYASVCGPESVPDFAAVRQRVNKQADIAPAFEAVARRREAKAREAEAAGHPVSARNSYFIAAVLWGSAQWTIEENTPQNLFYNERKRDCYMGYARLADHKVEPAWIAFQGKRLPGWFHLPYNYQGGRVPAVVSFQGMDGFKEMGVNLHGDRWLSRGIGVLAVEGPGQYESPVLGIHVSVPAWVEAAPLLMNWMCARPEIDAERVGLFGSSFGSFFATLCAANEPRFAACAVRATCLEPGGHSIFEEAPPPFKRRFMYMADYTDEAAFDQFRKTLTWEGHAEKIRSPYLCMAGEADNLSPLHHTERMFAVLNCPKQLVVYQDAPHGLGGVSSHNLGPDSSGFIADWMHDRLHGGTMSSERWYVQASGQIVKTAY